MRMACPMPWPCCGPHWSTWRMSRSSVPWISSMRSGMCFTIADCLPECVYPNSSFQTLVEDSGTNGPRGLVQLRFETPGGGRLLHFDVDDHVADRGVGLQILPRDIDIVPREYRVDLREHARLIAMDMQQAMLAGMLRQRHLREVDGRQGGSVIAIPDQLDGHLDADIRLRL